MESNACEVASELWNNFDVVYIPPMNEEDDAEHQYVICSYDEFIEDAEEEEEDGGWTIYTLKKEKTKEEEDNDLEPMNEQADGIIKEFLKIVQEEGNDLFTSRGKETSENLEHNLEEIKSDVGIQHERGVQTDAEDDGWKIHTSKKNISKKKRGIVVVAKRREGGLVKGTVKIHKEVEKGLYAKMAAEILRKEEEERAMREDI